MLILKLKRMMNELGATILHAAWLESNPAVSNLAV